MTLRALTVRAIPEALLRQLKATARRHRRSLNSEVLTLLEASVAPAHQDPLPGTDPKPHVQREPALPSYEVARAFEEASLSRLRSDLALTPEQRVHLAEELALAVPSGRRRWRVN